jgi:hypothetical protein
MAESEQPTPDLGRVASRLTRVGCCLAFCGFIAGCLGGPHPVPPRESLAQTPTLPSSTGNTAASNVAGTGSSTQAQPIGDVAAAGAPAVPTIGFTPTTGAAAGSGASSTPNPAAGAGGGTSASGAAGSGAAPPVTMPSAGASGQDSCQGELSLARGSAPDNVLFLIDRSADMASDYQGAPRWQQSDRALVAAITPLTAASLKIGALFYPSSASAAPACVGPAWLCPAPSADSTTCGVSAMGSNDQVALQPAAAALAALSGSPALFTPIDGTGVPLRESIERVNSALAVQSISGRTSVVLMANAQPSCRWDRSQASNMLASWRTQRSISTHVIALPGANPAGLDELSALASAGGQSRVLAPANADALRSELQSIALGSLTSCTLALDPAVTNAQDAHLIVGVHGVEQEMARNDASGAALWTLSADGKQLNLLGALCAAAQRGDYDSLTVRVGCVHLPPATVPGAQ